MKSVFPPHLPLGLCHMYYSLISDISSPYSAFHLLPLFPSSAQLFSTIHALRPFSHPLVCEITISRLTVPPSVPHLKEGSAPLTCDIESAFLFHFPNCKGLKSFTERQFEQGWNESRFVMSFTNICFDILTQRYMCHVCVTYDGGGSQCISCQGVLDKNWSDQHPGLKLDRFNHLYCAQLTRMYECALMYNTVLYCASGT